MTRASGTGASRLGRVILIAGAGAVVASGLGAGPAHGTPVEIGDAPSWARARVAWRAAVDARRRARWQEPLAALVAAERHAAAAESLYKARLFAWTSGPSAVRVPLDVLRHTALDCLAWNRPALAGALLEGPLRDDEVLRPLRAAALGRAGSPAEGLALLGWPPDGRPSRGGTETGSNRDARRGEIGQLARLLTAATLSEQVGDAPAARAAWRALIEGSGSGSAARDIARLRLAAGFVAEGTPRAAAELLRGPASGEQAVLLGEALAAAGDTLGALEALTSFGAESGASVAERFPALDRAAAWAAPFADRMPEKTHADLCLALGRVGEADRALRILAAREREPADADGRHARGDLEASLLARARRYHDAAAAYRALATHAGLPHGAPERIALGLARASRGGRAFEVMDSAYIAAVALAGRGEVAEQAAWERAREWEDERPAREAARVLGWAAERIRTESLRAAARVHEALAWRRSGEADSALAALARAPASDVMTVYWRGQLALEAGDEEAARAEFLRAARIDPASYEGTRAAEEAARLGQRPGAEPALAARDERPEPAPIAIEIRLLEALGWPDLAADLLRDCARSGEAPQARACIDELEEAGRFRVGKRSLHPAGRFDYPPAFPSVVLEAADAESLPPSLLWGIMRQESAYDPTARSRAGALGLLQLLPTTAARIARRKIPDDSLTAPALNVRLGARYVRDLLREFGDPRAVLASYNAGEAAVRRWNRDRRAVDDAWVERIPYRETRDYVKRVYAAWRRYEAIYGVGGVAAGG